MAVRFDASGDYLLRTANLPSPTAFGACGWAVLDVDRNASTCFFALESGTSSAAATIALFADSDGTSLKLFSPAGGGVTSGTLASLVVGQPFFWAVTGNGAGAGGLTAYYRTAGSNTLSSVSIQGSTFSQGALFLGNNSYAEWFNGRAWNAKVWDRVPSASELLIESYFARPQFPTSQNLWLPMYSHLDVADRSGNGRNPTVGGTLTTGDTLVNLWNPRTRIFLPSSSTVVHAASGDLVGPGAVISGTAARTRSHGASGSLTGPGSSIVGSAQHNTPHASSGDLVGPGSTLAGTAARTRQHPSSGDLVGPGSTVAGTAARTRAHASSGVLTGPGSVVDGAAARTRQHASSGDLVGPGSVIVGSADHQAAAGTHDATGALVGPGSAIAGAAARKRTFASSGALVGPGSVVVGSAARVAGSVSHDATGALVGPGSIINGTAARANPPVSHNATGALIGPGSIVVGEARNGAEDPQVGIFWPPFWWYKNEELEEELEKLAPEVKEVIIEAAEKAINDEPVEIRAELKKEKIRYRNQYKEIYLRIVEEMRQSEEDEEIAAIVAFL